MVSCGKPKLFFICAPDFEAHFTGESHISKLPNPKIKCETCNKAVSDNIFEDLLQTQFHINHVCKQSIT